MEPSDINKSLAFTAPRNFTKGEIDTGLRELKETISQNITSFRSNIMLDRTFSSCHKSLEESDHDHFTLDQLMHLVGFTTFVIHCLQDHFQKNRRKKEEKEEQAVEAVENEVIDLTKIKDPVVIRHPHDAEHVLCVSPPLKGQVNANAVTLSDYGNMADKLPISDSVLNYMSSREAHKYEVSGRNHVLLLNTDFHQRLHDHSWQKFKNGQLGEYDLRSWCTRAKLWQKGGARYVVLHICDRGHFYTLVGILSETSPVIAVLESVGGGLARIPKYGNRFREFLETLRAEAGRTGPRIEWLIPEMARQGYGSNNCGIFAMKYYEEILKQPSEFEKKLRKNQLKDWVSSKDIPAKRLEVVEHLKEEAIKQKDHNSLVELPLKDPNVVYDQVKTRANMLIAMDLEEKNKSKTIKSTDYKDSLKVMKERDESNFKKAENLEDKRKVDFKNLFEPKKQKVTQHISKVKKPRCCTFCQKPGHTRNKCDFRAFL